MKIFIKTIIMIILGGLSFENVAAQSDALKILSNGNVGIGTTTPSSLLDVNGNLKAKSATFTSNTTSNNANIGDMGFGADWAGFAHKNSVGKGRYGFLHSKDGFYSLINIKSGTGYIALRVDNLNKVVVKPNGNVGIGVDSPTKSLDIGGTGGIRINRTDGASTNNEILFADNGQIRSRDNNHRLIFDRANNIMEMREFGNIIFSPGATSGSRTQKVVIKSNGYVGIGTANPSKGKLEVTGWSNYDFYIMGGQGNIGGKYKSYRAGKGVWGSSIYAEGKMVSFAFVVPSDSRIKEIKGPSNTTSDLKKLNEIKITDYRYKDTLANGDKWYKKVIAQQIEKVYPIAVSTSINEIPDIYRSASLENGWVNLSINLKPGEKVCLLFKEEKEICEVIEVTKKGFRVDSDKEGKVFVYGRQVEDFLTVDYDALSMLNISATQELSKQVNQLQKKNAKTEAALTKALAKLEALENKLDKLIKQDEAMVLDKAEN